MGESAVRPNRKLVALVTGATGFVGSHLVRRLARDGWTIHVLSRVGSRSDEHASPQAIRHIHDGGIESMLECVARCKPDVVFHLASLFLSEHNTRDVDPLIQSNVLFGSQLLEAMSVNKITRFLNTGTSWQHYENEPYNPVCLYAATKQAFETILEYYVQACSINAITLKLFDTYGPEDHRKKLLTLLKKAALTGVPLDMSPGEQLIDIVHIDDVIEAYIIGAERLLDGQVTKHERYAVSSGSHIPLKELVQVYANAIKRPIPVNWGVRPYRTREVMVPWDHGTLIEAWAPRISLADGLCALEAKVVNQYE